MSVERLKIGFIPLVDAAIPIIAADLGFAADEGLSIELVREISWSNIRDRLTLGHFDAAHLLAPIAIASTLGLGTLKVPLAAPMALGLNGNAITLSPRLYDEVVRHLAPGADIADPAATAAALAIAIRVRRTNGDDAPTIGMTFPFSTHNYQLRLWLAASGLLPDEDLRLAVVPPPYMVDALASGHVEGFCVGSPWNSVAVELGIGRIIHIGVDLVRRCPEKVLAVRAAWLDERPETVARLVRACTRAAAWLDEPANRQEASDRLGAPDRIDVPSALIRRALDGRLPTGDGAAARSSDAFIMFAKDDAARPDPRHAAWLHEQMRRWGQSPLADDQAAAAVYRPDVFDAAVGSSAKIDDATDPLGVFAA